MQTLLFIGHRCSTLLTTFTEIHPHLKFWNNLIGDVLTNTTKFPVQFQLFVHLCLIK